MSLPMDAGDVIIANDTELWHNASPINTIDELDAGHMDAFVLTIK